MSEQYMASVIYLRLEELRSDVFWGWTKAKVDEIKELFDEYLSTQAGERKDLFLKVAELEEKIRVLEGQVKFKESEVTGLVDSYREIRTKRIEENHAVGAIVRELADRIGLRVVEE